MPLAMRMFIATHVALYRLTGGLVGSKMMGATVVLLTTTGNKTGKRRTVPVMSFDRDGKTYVIASAAGAPEHPAWYKNLVKTPVVGVQVGSRRYQASAVSVEGAEREQLWSEVKAKHANFAAYESKTTRVIPLVRLDEVGS